MIVLLQDCCSLDTWTRLDAVRATSRQLMGDRTHSHHHIFRRLLSACWEEPGGPAEEDEDEDEEKETAAQPSLRL